MVEDLIIETESIDTTNLSEEEKLVIDHLESTEIIKFDLTWNCIYFSKKDRWWGDWWYFKNDEFRYSYYKIYQILQDKYEYKQQQINNLVKHILLKHYKINVAITI